MTALEVVDVVAGYNRHPVLTGVSLRFEPARVSLLIGPNGAGKSTLLSTIYGLTNLMDGRVLLDGRDVSSLPPWERRQLGLGLVPQGRANFPEMSVHENLLIAAEEGVTSNISDAIDDVCQRLPFLRRSWRSVAGNLSGGQQQLLETAMVLLGRPKVILLDEPSLGLSPAWQSDVFGFVAQLASDGMTVVMVEQNVIAGLEIADWVVLMEQGSIVLQGRPDEIRDTAALRAAYLGAPAEDDQFEPSQGSAEQRKARRR
jgi:branched-chain amino acid transport system ATP-binding protein